jgi:hypothetical protein
MKHAFRPLASRAALIAAALLVAGCASAPPGPDDARLLIQLCDPREPPDGPMQVSSVEKGMYGSPVRGVATRTLNGQPVVEGLTHVESEHKAVTVRTERGEQAVEYVYKPPRRLPREGWTEWLPPVQRTRSDNAAYRIIYGNERQLASETIPADSPKIRYQRMTMRQFFERTRQPRPSAFEVPRCF